MQRRACAHQRRSVAGDRKGRAVHRRPRRSVWQVRVIDRDAPAHVDITQKDQRSLCKRAHGYCFNMLYRDTLPEEARRLVRLMAKKAGKVFPAATSEEPDPENANVADAYKLFPSVRTAMLTMTRHPTDGARLRMENERAGHAAPCHPHARPVSGGRRSTCSEHCDVQQDAQQKGQVYGRHLHHGLPSRYGAHMRIPRRRGPRCLKRLTHVPHATGLY